jgi:hypothetical protein
MEAYSGPAASGLELSETGPEDRSSLSQLPQGLVDYGIQLVGGFGGRDVRPLGQLFDQFRFLHVGPSLGGGAAGYATDDGVSGRRMHSKLLEVKEMA